MVKSQRKQRPNPNSSRPACRQDGTRFQKPEQVIISAILEARIDRLLTPLLASEIWFRKSGEQPFSEREKTMLSRKSIHIGWAIFFQWVIFSMLGWLVATILSMLPPNLDTILSNTAFYIVWALLLLALGAVIGATQWLILRRYFSGAVRWVVASGVGMAIGGIAAFPLKLRDLYVGTSGFQLDEIAYGVVFGFLMGGAQWLVMRTWVQSAGWWVLSSTIGWTLGMAVGELLSLNWSNTYTGHVYGMITEVIPAAATGLALVMLLQNPLDSKSIMDKSAG